MCPAPPPPPRYPEKQQRVADTDEKDFVSSSETSFLFAAMTVKFRVFAAVFAKRPTLITKVFCPRPLSCPCIHEDVVNTGPCVVCSDLNTIKNARI